MYNKQLLSILIIFICTMVHAEQAIEINSDTPYSSGVIKFTDEDIHFSTGLTLTQREYAYNSSFSDIFLSTSDTLLYTSYVTVPTKDIEEEKIEPRVYITTHSAWEQVREVDTSVKLLDSIQENFCGHCIYTERSFFPSWYIDTDTGITDILVSQDSTGNYIKWQIADIDVTIDTSYDDMVGVTYTPTLHGIYLKWEIDSLGNGKFPCSPVSNKKIISDSRSKNYIQHIQVNNRLTFPAFKTLNIAIYKSNGQLLKVSDGMTNFIELSGISKGFYIARIESKGMNKSVGFRIE